MTTHSPTALDWTRPRDEVVLKTALHSPLPSVITIFFSPPSAGFLYNDY